MFQNICILVRKVSLNTDIYRLFSFIWTDLNANLTYLQKRTTNKQCYYNKSLSNRKRARFNAFPSIKDKEGVQSLNFL